MLKWAVGLKTRHIIAFFLFLGFAGLALFAAPPARAVDESDLFVTAGPEEEKPETAAPVIPPALIAIEKRVSECAIMEDRILRLKCYDELAVANGFMNADKLEDEKEILGKYGLWNVSKRRDASGEEYVYLKLPAEQQIETMTGLKKTPEFIIKCRTKETEAYLDWKGPLVGSRYYIKGFYVVSRIGMQEEVHKDWELSRDKFAAFYPEPIEFVRELKKEKKLALKLTPQNDTVRVVTFKLDGIDKALDVVVKNCYN